MSVAMCPIGRGIHATTRAARVGRFLLLAGSVLGCGEEVPATFVQAVYGDGCKFVECPATSVCASDESGAGTCHCYVGYVGAECDRCEPGFHRDALDRCVSDKGCSDLPENPCGSHGECTDESGVLECRCDAVHAGPRCQLCADGYSRNRESECVPAQPPVALDGGMDSGTDAGLPDSGTYDSGVLEAGALDSTIPETGTPDTGTCQPGYAGASCNECAPGFHRNDQLCIPDETCGPASCPDHATCIVIGPEARCECNPGYTGDPCERCPMQMFSEHFDQLSGWPQPPNTCTARPELALTALALHSRQGEGTVQLCAPSTIHGLTTPHLELEAGPALLAELHFAGPTEFVSFSYATRLQALSLDVLADGEPVGSIDLPRKSTSTFSLELDPPASTVSLRSRTPYLQNVAIDDIMHRSPSCK